jgi:glycerophosphoryl diester phosphodiesterase
LGGVNCKQANVKGGEVLTRAMRIIAAFLVVGAGLTGAWYNGLLVDFYANYPVREALSSQRPNYNLRIIAHRGDELRYPENTLAAFRSAVDLGADFLEVDMRLTADNVWVVLHDGGVGRTTDGKGPIHQLTFAEARALDAGSWFAPEFSGERIPTVAEVLEVAQGKACLMADIKEVPNRELIDMLKRFAEKSGKGCLYISIYRAFHFDVAEFERLGLSLEQLEPEAQKLMRSAAEYRLRIGRRQLAAFNRYWPEFPFNISFVESSDIKQMMRDYPNMAAVEISRMQATPERLKEFHDNGIFTYSLVLTNKDNAEIDMPATYMFLANAGIKGVFISDPRTLLAFKESVMADGK